MTHPKTVGQSPPRTDGVAKVRGDALYVDDIHYDGLWYGLAVRRPEASAVK